MPDQTAEPPVDPAAAPLGAPAVARPSAAGRLVGDGLVVLIASLTGHLGNFLFYVVGARSLDPAQFAALASLTSMALIVLTPINGVQAAMARDVAQFSARGRGDEVRALTRWLFGRVLVAQVVLFALLAALTPVSTAVLGLDRPLVWLLAAVWFALGISGQALLGPIQGLGRFRVVAWVLAGPLGLLRLVFLIPLVSILGLPGALIALIVATLVGVGTAVGSLRIQLRPLRGLFRARHPAQARRMLGLPVACLLAFAAITNVDIVAAKIRLPAGTAGTYSSAALLGKVALYATVSLGLVLLPRVSERIARGLDYVRVTLLTAAAVVGVGLLTALAFFVAPDGLVVVVFGPAYERAAGLIVPITLIMTAAGLLNVHLTVAIARRDRVFGLAFIALALAHLAALLVFGRSIESLIAANALVIGSGVVLVELFSRHGVVRLLARKAAGTRRSDQPAHD